MLDANDQLMARAGRGDATAIDEIANLYSDALMSYFKKVTNSTQLAKDLVQNTLVRVWRSAESYKPCGIFERWLFRVAGNIARDWHRRQRNDLLASCVGIDGVEVACDSRVPAVEVSDTVDLIRGIVEKLPEKQRQVFLLFVVEGVSLPEIAKRMNATLPTAKSRLRLARSRIQQLVEEAGIVSPLMA